MKISRVPSRDANTHATPCYGQQYLLWILVVLLAGAFLAINYSWDSDTTKVLSKTRIGSFPDDIFSLTPFCTPDGTCREDPATPTPRTVYSSKSSAAHGQWWKFHLELNRNAQDYANRLAAASNRQSRRPFILLGDSITESWLGTGNGLPSDRAKGVASVLKGLLKHPPLSKLDPLIQAISGDQTQHLLYRLQNGGLLPAYADDPTAIFVVLIGTNNLGAGEVPEQAAKGVIQVVQTLLQKTKGHLFVLDTLPRGDGQRLQRICPPRCQENGKAYTSFLPAIQKLNAAVREGIVHLSLENRPHRVDVLDCSQPFFNVLKEDQSEGAEEVDIELMPDRLHPNAEGHKLLGECILNHVRGLEKG